MKPILLLIAIYSLIIHQSQKNAKEMAMPAKKPMTKAILLQTNSYKKQIISSNSGYLNAAGYVGRNNNDYARQESKQ